MEMETVPQAIVVRLFPRNGHVNETSISKQVEVIFKKPELFFGEREINLLLRPLAEGESKACLLEKAKEIDGISLAFSQAEWPTEDRQHLLRDEFDLLLGP